MCRGETPSSLALHGESLKSNAALQNKLVLHRGWHCLENKYLHRPLENTRQAYTDSVKAGARFAECDVWVTKDGTLVLNHDATFAAVAKNPDDRLAKLPISSLEWQELSVLELQDGSTPVTLDTVLEDLLGTRLQLVIELKTSLAASTLGAHLAFCSHLVHAVAWVMSFSLATLERFLEDGGRQAGCRSAWLLDNPREAYSEEHLDEDETLWDYASEDLVPFLERVGMKNCFQQLQCGLYLQYNPGANPADIRRARAQMNSLVPDAEHKPFIGLWSDAKLDASFDCEEVISPWLDVIDFINTDLPHGFWFQLPEATAESALQVPAHPVDEYEGKACSDSSDSTDCESSVGSSSSADSWSPAHQPSKAAQDPALPFDLHVLDATVVA